jgi:dihydrofolate reductase
MRKIATWLLASLDGVIESPETWQQPYATAEMGEVAASGMSGSGTLLFGRKTYQKFVQFWPHQGSDVPFADVMNKSQKLVVSNTLKTVDWANSTLVSGDVLAEIRRIKSKPGKDIVILGSGMLVRSLLQAQLIDRLQILVHPLVLGRGQKLFEQEGDRVPLQLLESKTLKTGIVSLTYAPAPPTSETESQGN